MGRKSKRVPEGVAFPLTGGTGARSTTKTGKKILAKALEGVGSDKSAESAKKLMAERNWRFGYRKHMVNLVAEMQNHNACLSIAEAGLREARETFMFSRNGEEMPLDAVVGSLGEGPQTRKMKIKLSPFYTGRVQGNTAFQGSRIPDVPYKGRVFRGEDLVQLAATFVRESQADASFESSVRDAVKHEKKWFDLRGKVFVLIGATSEMGPLEFLLECGATVVAIARPNSRSKPLKWSRLLDKVKKTPGTLLFPISRVQKSTDDASTLASVAGADATAQTPEIIQWLCSDAIESAVKSGGSPLHIYCGIYLDGEGFVRASVAMDAIVDGYTAAYPKNPPTLLYIDTPSHVHLVPSNMSAASARYRASAPFLLRCLAAVGLAKTLSFRDVGCGNRRVMNGLALEQGPNYGVAKFLQRWRALLAHEKYGSRVSITVGPAAKTDSVMHSSTMAFVMNHAHKVKPNTAHMPNTVKALMSILLVRDLHASSKFSHPLDLVVENAWHGGMWTSPYEMKGTAVYLYLSHYGGLLVRGLAVVCLAALLAWKMGLLV